MVVYLPFDAQTIFVSLAEVFFLFLFSDASVVEISHSLCKIGKGKSLKSDKSGRTLEFFLDEDWNSYDGSKAFPREKTARDYSSQKEEFDTVFP